MIERWDTIVERVVPLMQSLRDGGYNGWVVPLMQWLRDGMQWLGLGNSSGAMVDRWGGGVQWLG